MDVERPEVELLRVRYAVDLGQDAVAADAADVEAVEPQTGRVAFDVDAGFVLHEVRDVLVQVILDVFVGDDGDVSGGVAQRGRNVARGDGYLVEEGRVAGGICGLCLRLAGGRGGFLAQNRRRAKQDAAQAERDGAGEFGKWG